MSMNATFIKSVAALDQLPDDDIPHVAFVGRSNVGKSSLINYLTGIKGLANVSSWPGRTQTLNFFRIDRKFYLVDLPGYGFAKKSQAQKVAFLALITDYLQTARLLKFVVLIVDSRVGLTDLDEKMLAFLQKAGVSFVLIANKIDKLTREERVKFLRHLDETYPAVPVIPHSSTKRTGRGPILAAIEAAL